MDKSIGTTANRKIQQEIKGIKQEIKTFKEGVKDLKSAQAKRLQNLLGMYYQAVQT